MKRPRLLITGFSSFPGTRLNPTEALIAALHVKSLGDRLGVDLVAAVLPTEYSAVGILLPEMWRDVGPDAVIHFGLHGRTRSVRVESRAKNYMSPIQPDAAGSRPLRSAISPDGPPMRRTNLPIQRIAAAIRRRGVTAVLSPDAGSYLCNYASYLSAGLAKKGELSGFVHLPWPAEERAPKAPPDRPNWDQLEIAIKAALSATAVAVRGRERMRSSS